LKPLVLLSYEERLSCPELEPFYPFYIDKSLLVDQQKKTN